MKIFVFLILTLCVQQQLGALFELDLSSGLSQFVQFQPANPSSAKVADDTDGTTTFSDNKVIKFDNVTRYAGIITKDWIVSPVLKKFTIKIDFRGRIGKHTGAFLGYYTKENENIVKALALDHAIIMDYYQQLQFEPKNDWTTYTFQLPQSEGIKLILEKGSYNGMSENLEMAFKGLKVTDLELGTNCPGTPEDKIMKSYYFGTLFKNDNFEGRVKPNCIDHGEKLEIQFIFPTYTAPCILTSIYAFDSNQKVIEAFKPTLTQEVDAQNKETGQSLYSQFITLSELTKYGCTKTSLNLSSTNSDTDNYECPIKLYFWLDYAESYATKQLEYDYVKNNSYALFSSSFKVQVNKQTSTFLNTLVKTLVKPGVCPGNCQLDLSLKLDMKVKYGNADYITQSSAMTVVWGDPIYFQITSIPSDYTLSLMTVFVQTESGDEFMKMPDLFIDSFIENKKSSKGLLSFSMKASGEAGLSRGSQMIYLRKPFNLKFLVKSAATGRILEATYASSDLPTAAINENPLQFTISDDKEEEKTPVTIGASKISAGIIIMILLFLLS